MQDLARATLTILEAADAIVAGQAFNIDSDDQNYRISDLAGMLAAESGCDVEVGDDAVADPRSYRVDFGKLT